MSSVQYSSSSSVLGTLSSSLPHVRRDTPPHARVCRSLFGPVDHEELNREMKAKLVEIAERDRRRWNFDFGAGVPLLGEYEWEEAPGETSPAFYQECVRAGRAEDGARTPSRKDGSPSERAELRALPENGTKKSTDPTRKSAPRKRPSALSTTRVTDFYVKRRSGGGVRLCERGGRKPFPSNTEEQTPRKRIR